MFRGGNNGDYVANGIQQCALERSDEMSIIIFEFSWNHENATFDDDCAIFCGTNRCSIDGKNREKSAKFHTRRSVAQKVFEYKDLILIFNFDYFFLLNRLSPLLKNVKFFHKFIAET